VTERRFTTAGPTHAHDLGLVPCVICGGSYRDHDADTLACPTPLPEDVRPPFSPGDRVLHLGKTTGEVLDVYEDAAHVYFGTADGKRYERWVPLQELAPIPEEMKSTAQLLEDLL